METVWSSSPTDSRSIPAWQLRCQYFRKHLFAKVCAFRQILAGDRVEYSTAHPPLSTPFSADPTEARRFPETVSGGPRTASAIGLSPRHEADYRLLSTRRQAVCPDDS